MSKKSNSILHHFAHIVQYNKHEFIGYLDLETYIEINYVGWNQKNLNSYKIQIWRDECGYVFEQIKRFSNINDAIVYAVENVS